MDPGLAVEIGFACAAAIGFCIWGCLRKPWLWTACAFITALLCSASVQFGILFAIWYFPMIVVAFAVGGCAGSIARQALAGPEMIGPDLNPAWHGAIAGVIVSLTLGPAVLIAYESFGGIRPSDLLTGIFSMRAEPPFGLPALVSRVLFGAISGFVCQLLFGNLRGAASWIGWSVGYCLLLASYSDLVGIWHPLPELKHEMPLYAVYKRLVLGSAYGLGMMGVLAAMRSTLTSGNTRH